MKVLWIVLSVMMLGTVHEASASQKTTACLNSCTAQLATCSDVCVGQFGIGAKSCRKAILKRCKKMGADAACPPEVTTTSNPGGSATTSTTVGGSPTTSTTLATSNCSGTFCDLGDGTVLDSATGLQWEQKTTEVGSGVDPTNLHDVDNHYAWVGTCSHYAGTAFYCQPNQAAQDICNANSSLADRVKGCQQCGPGEGPCDMEAASSVEKNPITTVWDWLNQLNAANFAGHNDWRLPNEAGCHTGMVINGQSCSAFNPHELETILRGVGQTACKPYPCIADIFGPTAVGSIFTYYYTGTADTDAGNPSAWAINFFDGTAHSLFKPDDGYVRAVRTAQ
jgi:Protein of unknown function (DUF1566)